MKRNSIRVGLYDMDIFDLNFGVNALGICNLMILNDISKKNGLNIKYTFFTPHSTNEVKSFIRDVLDLDLDIKAACPISIRHQRIFWKFYKEVKKCDIVIDATGGDSFADIYGNTRIIRGSICKFIIEKKSKLFLPPQTIGPFKHKYNELFAKTIMRHAIHIFVRDNLSYDYVKNIVPSANLNLATDVAFRLPYDVNKYCFPSDDIVDFGINISGLLWNGGYSGDNQFNLALNYQELIRRIIVKYSHNPKYRVHLIAHVIEDGAYEDDYYVCSLIADEYKNTILAPKFTGPIDAKSYMCHLDVFAGARMHATIGAFSSGVPTIPIAYSRKFKGLFGSLGYDVLVDCKSLNTDQAFNLLCMNIENIQEIENKMKVSITKAKKALEYYEETLAYYIKQQY